LSTCHRISAIVLRIDSIENYIANPEAIDSAMLAENMQLLTSIDQVEQGFSRLQLKLGRFGSLPC